MTDELLEGVPNISEGRRESVIGEVANSAGSALGGVRGALLDLHSDPDHNRSVLTLAGDAEALGAALGAVAARSVELIDLRSHSGAHPRMGAIDVVPFVPLGSASEQHAVDAAVAFAARVWEELRLPCYLYGAAAVSAGREVLPAVRKPFEALQYEMDRGFVPDVGDAVAHPTAGAVAVGARAPMVAFNVVLATADVRVAKAIAAEVRERDGGLPGVRALGFALPALGVVQVSMNLVRPESTGVWEAFQAVRSAAVRRSLDVCGAELVGLAPRAAVAGCSSELLEMAGIDDSHILEDRLRELGLTPS